METMAAKSLNFDRATVIITTPILVLMIFAPAIWRILAVLVLPRGMDFAFYSYQMPLLQGALVAVLLWRGDVREIFCSPASRALHPLLAVLALGFLSAIFSDAALISILHQARWFIWGCFVVVLAAFVAGGEGRAKMIIDLIVVGFIFYAAFIHMLVFALDHDEVNWLYQVPGYSNIRFLGQTALAALILSYCALFKSETDLRVLPFLWRVLPVALCWTMVFWSGSRAATLAAVATLGILAVSGHMRRPAYVAVVTLAAALIAVSWSMAISVGEGSFGLLRLIEATQRLSNVETASIGRMVLWPATLGAIPDTLILGHGAGTFSFALPTDWAMYNHPHNLLLQALFDWGIIIGTAFLSALAWLGWNLFRAPARYRHAAVGPTVGTSTGPETEIGASVTVGFGLFTAMLVASMVDGTLFHPEPLMLTGVGLALALPGMRRLSRYRLPRSMAVIAGAGAAACFALYMIAASATVAAGARAAPAYDSLRARVVQTLPYGLLETFGLYNYGRWIDQWIGVLSPEVIEAELERTQHFSRWDVPQQIVATRQACAQGNLAGAHMLLDQLDQDESAYVRAESAYLRQALDDYWGGCPTGDNPRSVR